MKMSTFACVFLLLFTIFIARSISASDSMPKWPDWVHALRTQALSEGIRARLFDQVFDHMKEPDPIVLHYAKTQPEKRLTFLHYRNTRANHFRILLGKQMYRKHHVLLKKIAQQYAVNACIILSLWGLETSYGRYMGHFPVIRSLATLAYRSHRHVFFRKELLLAIHILNEGHVALNDFKGEWAGATGQPQFLPSSFYAYAVDYDGDGKKDIWHSYPDVLASIANYLEKHGWHEHEPWAIPITSSKPLNSQDMSIIQPLKVWYQRGIRLLHHKQWPSDMSITARLIAPEGGPYFLVFNNFYVLMKWNHSSYYAATVGYMAEQICN